MYPVQTSSGRTVGNLPMQHPPSLQALPIQAGKVCFCFDFCHNTKALPFTPIACFAGRPNFSNLRSPLVPFQTLRD
jgi:hypothetical protein